MTRIKATRANQRMTCVFVCQLCKRLLACRRPRRVSLRRIHSRVVVRVRDRDGLDAAKALNLGGGLLIKQGDAVPEDIPLGRLDQQGTLPDSKLRLCPDTNQTWLMFLHHVMESLCLHRYQRCPLLAIVPDVLACIQADRTSRWRHLARWELRSTCLTNPFFHR